VTNNQLITHAAPPTSLPPALPASPPATRRLSDKWRDKRLYIGLALVFASVLAGALLLSNGNKSVEMLAARTDLAAGSTLTEDDIVTISVNLFDTKNKYFSHSAKKKILGQRLTRDINKGELFARGSLQKELCGSLVSIPVAANNLPPTVQKGQRINLYTTSSTTERQTQRILAAVAVQEVARPKSGLLSNNAQWSLLVRVPDKKAGQIVQSMHGAELDVTVVDQPGADSDPCSAGSEIESVELSNSDGSAEQSEKTN
jgi:hypothetical protein